ncbi:asparagine synthase-related protein [Blastococcus sp. SYSU D00820]
MNPFTAAVASGAAAVEELRRVLASRIARGSISWAAHEGLAVAWTAEHRWVTSADDGDVLVVLDGHLHNLFEEGRSHVDLLHHRYRSTGERVADGLLGDFVAIVLDRRRGRLLVARDPVGVRPWYQARSGVRHSGASEVATLCAQSWVDDSVDKVEALAYLAGDMRSIGPTLHRGITSLGPGATWISTGDAHSVRLHHRWDIRAEPDVSWDEAVERSRAAVDEAVRDRVRAIGAATSELSGGIDSSAIVGTLVEFGYDDVLAGRLLFEGPRADERTFSDAVLEHWGLRAVSAAPWLPTAEETDRLVHDLRRPPPDPNFTMSVGLHRALLDAGRTSALSGLGGDDAFTAMSTPSLIVSALQQRRRDLMWRLARTTVTAPWPSWQQLWRPTLGHLRARRRTHVPPHVDSRAARRSGLLDRLRSRPLPVTGVEAVDERCDGLTSGYLARILEDGAIVADLSRWRTTHPLLDPRVIQATYGLDPWFPVRGGHFRALQVAAFRDRLPPMVRERQSKAEFSEVVQQPDDDRAREIAAGPLSKRGWLEPAALARLRHAQGDAAASAAFHLARTDQLDRWFRTRAD